jgi:hypothetical protein
MALIFSIYGRPYGYRERDYEAEREWEDYLADMEWYRRDERDERDERARKKTAADKQIQ